MRESRTCGSVRGARDETRVPTAPRAARVHHAARRGGGVAGSGAGAADTAAYSANWPSTIRDGSATAFEQRLNNLGQVHGINVELLNRFVPPQPQALHLSGQPDQPNSLQGRNVPSGSCPLVPPSAGTVYSCGPERLSSRSARNTLLYTLAIQRRPLDVIFR
jgi:hypothetical protein